MKPLIFLFILIFTVPLMAQDDEELYWNKNERLSWSDFKAKPQKNLPYKANTNSGISFSWNSTQRNKDISLDYKVESIFYPNKSWVKEIEEVDYLLAHEQLHFDITELHARKLRKALENYKPGNNIKKELDSIYSVIEKQRQQMQNRFDKETNHSINKETEFEWREFVEQELEKLNKYS